MWKSLSVHLILVDNPAQVSVILSPIDRACSSAFLGAGLVTPDKAGNDTDNCCVDAIHLVSERAKTGEAFAFSLEFTIRFQTADGILSLSKKSQESQAEQ